jgi:hypothetical protein
MFFCKLNTGVDLDFVEREKPMARMFMKIWLQYNISCKKGVHLLLVKTNQNFFQKKFMTITVFSLSFLMDVPDSF